MKKLSAVSTALALAFLASAGVAGAQTPGLSVGAAVPSAITASSAQTLATLTLTAGSSGVMLNSLPILLGYSEASPASPFNNCVLRNGSSAGTALNSGTNVMATRQNGQSLVQFDQALTIAANGSVALYLVCDISPAAINGSAVHAAVPVQFVAATTTAGAAVAVGGAGSQGGTPGGGAMVSSATSGVPAAPVTPGTPGVPNTGAGGAGAQTLAILVLSAIAALAGAGYLALRSRRAVR